MEKDETCQTLAQQLGKPYTAMRIGKLRKAVCEDEDLDGKYILPSGVLKIMAQIKGEIEVDEEAEPEVVRVRVLHHQTGNPRYIYAEDLETKRKVAVSVPIRKKAVLNTPGKRLKVNRGDRDGESFYRYPAR